LEGVVLRNLISTALALALVGCAAPKAASKLATLTSGHVNTLNAEFKQYVDAANASRKADAQRVAAAQTRWDQDNSYVQRFVTEWDIDKSTSLTNAFAALQKQSVAEMAITDSSLKRESEATAQLQAAYGQLSYTPAELQGVISALQSLASRDGDKAQVEAFESFSKTTLDDAKTELNSAKPAAEGVAHGIGR
jgi:hypothetical protein